MRSLLRLLSKAASLSVYLLWKLIGWAFRVFIVFLPAILVWLFMMYQTIVLDGGRPIFKEANPRMVSPLVPRTRWGNMKPCGQFFDEEKEFERALSCVNKKVYPKTPIKGITIPRCFVISSDSPDVFAHPQLHFNGVPLFVAGKNKEPVFLGFAVGVYDDKTHTVFVVENVDVRSIYRHELQHLFMAVHDHTDGGGHDQDIWAQCEPPYYQPSVKSELIGALQQDLEL